VLDQLSYSPLNAGIEGMGSVADGWGGFNFGLFDGGVLPWNKDVDRLGIHRVTPRSIIPRVRQNWQIGYPTRGKYDSQLQLCFKGFEWTTLGYTI
jgi:hypothetical protein